MHKYESHERKKNKKCKKCKKGTYVPKQMTLFAMPKVFTFVIHWMDPDDPDRDEIDRVFEFITPLIDIGKFMTTGARGEKDATYIFRGFVSYYGKHYMSYFYSELHDYWVHLNDSKITEVGNFKDVIDK